MEDNPYGYEGNYSHHTVFIGFDAEVCIHDRCMPKALGYALSTHLDKPHPTYPEDDKEGKE